MAAPFDAAARRQREFGKPLEIGADVWVGGGALIIWPACVAAREQSLAPEALSRAISRRVCSQPEIRVN